MKRVVLDSNILIGLYNTTIIVTELETVEEIFVSSITIMEIFALAGMSVEEEKVLKILLKRIVVIPVSYKIAEHAGRLARTRRIGKADLLIAATALELGLPLMTRNVKDFKKISGLKIV